MGWPRRAHRAVDGRFTPRRGSIIVGGLLLVALELAAILWLRGGP